jgi:hypothetical protein
MLTPIIGETDFEQEELYHKILLEIKKKYCRIVEVFCWGKLNTFPIFYLSKEIT